MSDQPQPGWYDDPSDPTRQRFWDGAAWGDQRRDKPPAGQPTPPAPEEEEKPAADNSNAKTGCLIIVVIAVVIAVLASMCGDGEGGSGGESMAYVMCQDFVERELRSPATAGFANLSEARITGSEPTWIVNAHVDSENGFGAMVRTEFTCEITYAGDDRWELESLELHE